MEDKFVSRRARRKWALQRQIGRLARRVRSFETLSRRFSWYRLGVILLTGLATWFAATTLTGVWGWVVFFSGVAIFLVVAVLHRRLEGWIERYSIWRELKATQLARIDFDWVELPEPKDVAGQIKRSLDVDLDITGKYSLHQLLDLSVSREGSQLLADWLLQSDPDQESIVERQLIVQELAPLSRFRERLLLNFRLVSQEDLEGGNLLRWIEQAHPGARLRWVLPIASGLVITNLILFLLSSVGAIPALWIVTLSIYGAFYSYHANLLREFLDALIVMDRELGKFQAILRYLEVYPLHTQVNLRRLCGPFRDPERLPSVFLRKIKFATAGVGLRMNPVLSLMVNLLLPWDFFFASLAAKYREEAAEVLPPWLQTWYKMEALISLANFSYLNPDYTFPVIESGLEPVFRAEGLGHPLIPPDQKVCNDFSVRGLGEIAIVTGSNMAGKSTFIKTLGINLCLAYAGGPVNASDFRSVPMRLHTCIQISDSVTDGFSYFYAEVKCLKQLMEALEAPQSLPVLYLIDEIFRGTNNRERLIGSRAYLKSVIGANGVGLLATHDLELASLADQNPVVRNFHFRDHVLDGELTFDYKIRPGASPTTNALIIMAMEGLPVEETDLPEIQ